VNFDLDDDQVALRDGIRGLCEGRFPMKRVRAGFDRATWDELREAGVFSLRADGFGVADATLVFEELGRALVPGPLVWGFLASGRVEGVVGGLDVRSHHPGLMLVEHLDALDVLAVIDDEGVRVVPAAVLDGTSVGQPLDPLTPLQRVDTLPEGERIGGGDLLAEWHLTGPVLTAAYLVGMAQACTQVSVAYAKERRQFDRPIGSFQAVKHILADMAVRTEVARVAVHAAACSLDGRGGDEITRAVSGAKLLAGEAALANGKAATQVHGGMGFTWEVDAHLYLKRAWVLDTVFGSTDEHADAVAECLPRST
jgi:alkylation response protein AidB-like acyl-CoA dehydrogenase